MNMLTFDKTDIQQQNKPFIAEAVFAVETISANLQREKQLRAKQLLDRLFPLERGSHQEVTSYVIDYHHVLAYFKNGQHTGLKLPKQFIAYTGGKEQPCSILFRDGNGSHVEVLLGYQRGTGCIELINIDDIQLETCTVLSQEVNDKEPNAVMRHWISLIKGNERGKPQACSEDKEYTAKCGEDYHLSYCFHL
ncbi:malate synthase [Vibrio cincinnatiensis]|uniref:Malate synthase n=1 Tax=Vibrio cincinnatiensis DSM 19608 TaxID=1123491 RepID=A0A1T4Q855_VIBCI|nr:malate synthase [Vibrio cincinnatiensis]SJZ99721.1 malate synthase [Vibrio cincinnatiensis DSM 19608]SUP05049.1 malate synthase [Vibrio cincinnatiensis]